MRPLVPQLPSFDALAGYVHLFRFRTVSRWVGLGLLVGVVSGLVAAAFFVGMSWLLDLVIDHFANWRLAEPAGEPSLFGSSAHGTPRAFVVVLAPALGGLVSGLLVSRFAPEAEGHGTDALIEAFHSGQALRSRVPLIKGVASVIIIGTGGSAGREGPIAQIGAALGGIIGRVLRVSERERRLLLIAGAAGGIGAIFRTPLGAALFVVEVLYRDDIEVDALVPAIFASVVGYSTFTAIFGEATMFAVASHYQLDPRQLPLYILMAVGCAVVGVLYIEIFYKMRSGIFAKIPLPRAFIPMLGGLGVGLLALAAPPALGAGYGWLQKVLLFSESDFQVGWIGAVTLLGIALLKVVTTSLTVSSGGSGGVFGPSVVIGGMVGGAFGVAFHEVAPTVVPDPAAFVIVGMASFVGGVAHAPISSLVMASEMTGSYDLLVPLMLAEAVTFVMMRPWTLYTKQVPTRKESGAHRAEYILDVLQELRVRDAYVPSDAVQTVSAATPLTNVLSQMCVSTQTVMPVLDKDDHPQGLVALDTLRPFLLEDDLGDIAIAADAAMPFVSLQPNDSLGRALERFMESGCRQLPVVDSDDRNRIIGILSYEDMLRVYDRELVLRGVKRTRVPSSPLSAPPRSVPSDAG